MVIASKSAAAMRTFVPLTLAAYVLLVSLAESQGECLGLPYAALC
jgi:hypothetical protein